MTYLSKLLRDDVRSEILRTALRFRGPGIASAIVFIGLWLPAQIREVYVVLAEDFVRTDSRNIGDIVGVFFRNSSFYYPYFMVFIACFWVWACARWIGFADPVEEPLDAVLQEVQKDTVRVVPRLIGLLPPLGLALGTFSTARAFRGERIAEALVEASVASIAVLFGYLMLLTVAARFRDKLMGSAKFDPDGIFAKAGTELLRDCAFIGAIALTILLYFQGSDHAQSAGPIVILCAFGQILAMVLTALYQMGIRWRIPLTGAVVVLVLFQSCVGLTDNDQLSMSDTVSILSPMDPSTPIDAYNAWAKSHGNSAPIVIAAQGGGLYAAYHTAMVLARLYDIDEKTGHRVLAVSGVSGGAVGAAIFDIIHRSSICKVKPDSTPKPDCYTNAVRRVLKRDFLSPLLASMLFSDFVTQLVPNIFGITNRLSRARRLEDAFDVALRHLFTEFDLDMTKIEELLDTPILTPWRAEGRPILMLNVTDVSLGERMVFTPLRDFGASSVQTYASVTGCKGSASCANPDTLAAALVSARFPYVTPAAQLTIRPKNGEEREARYVDGGYFDNSGVETARDFIGAIHESGRLDGEDNVDLIAMAFPRVEERQRNRTSSFDEIMAPIRTLLATRSARGELAKQRASDAVVPDVGFRYHTLRLDDTERAFTLGWILSENTFDRIECNLWNDEACERLGMLSANATGNSVDNLSQRSKISAWNRCIFDWLIPGLRASTDEPAFCNGGGGGF